MRIVRNSLVWLGLMALSIPFGMAGEYTYTSEDVVFDAKGDTIRIGATITSPVGDGPFAAVVIVSGTGPQDRDGTMGGHKLFARIADHLSTSGYVVLRMDDRGVGETTGDYRMATTADFANDALHAHEYLKTYPNVDPSRIGLLGHSEGGAAISIAASRSDEVAFLISLSGLASSGLESLFLQNENLVNQSPMRPADKKRSNEINRLMFATAYQYADSDNLESKLNETYGYWKEKDAIYFATLGIEHDHFRFPIWSYVQQATGPWYRYLVRYNPRLFLERVDVPILALAGDRDPFVPPVNLDYWKAYSASGRLGKVTTVLLPGVNHLLQECETCDPQEYASLDPIPLSTLSIISEWLETVSRHL